MSPTGSPDFGAKPSNSNTSPSFDTGEDINHSLMGGGNLSRSGRWFWASGFENGLVSDFESGGDVASIVKNSPPNWQGNYILYMDTLGVINSNSYIFKYFLANQSMGKWGIEAMVAMGYVSAEFEMQLNTQGKVTSEGCLIRIRSGLTNDDVKLYYVDENNNEQLIASLDDSFALSASVYHNIKLVADFQKNEYVRVLVDGTTYYLDGVRMRPRSTIAYTRQNFMFVNRTLTTLHTIVLIDNVILTADEP